MHELIDRILLGLMAQQHSTNQPALWKTLNLIQPSELKTKDPFQRYSTRKMQFGWGGGFSSRFKIISSNHSKSDNYEKRENKDDKELLFPFDIRITGFQYQNGINGE